MQLIAESELLTVYWLEDVRADYGVWTGLPRLEPTVAALHLAEGVLRERNSSAWISNSRRQTSIARTAGAPDGADA